MAQAEPLPSIPFETYKLKNGLNVILSEDHSIPFVQVKASRPLDLGLGREFELKSICSVREDCIAVI